MVKEFPTQQPGLNYLTEGGQETEIMYKYGFDLPHFAMFPLLDNPRAMTELKGMYGRYLNTAARHGFGVLVGGLDYRASPGLGHTARLFAASRSPTSSCGRSVSCATSHGRMRGRCPRSSIAGIVGPRGDAYETNHTITADEAEDYHSEQLATLAEGRRGSGRGHDLQRRARRSSDWPAPQRESACLSHVLFTLDHGTSRLTSGPSVKDAIETIDAANRG